MDSREFPNQFPEYDGELLIPPTEDRAFDGADVVKITSVCHGNIINTAQLGIGWIDIDPTEVRDKNGDPGM